jgi:tripartite ATP-independent transporter DctP family solute receptor
MNRRHCLALGVGALASRCVFSAASLSAKRLTAADVHPANYPTVTAVQWLSDQLAEHSNGELLIRSYHSAQLGREADTVDLVRIGALDLTRVFSGGLNNAVPETLVLGLPYLFSSVAHQRACLDGAVGTAVLKALESYQLKGLAIYDSGARHFYGKEPLATPAALKAKKIRVPVSDAFIALLNTLGANPTPLAYGAVYSALETGLIDGAENNLRSYHSSRHFETAPMFSESAHSYAPDLLVMSMQRWNALGQAQQDLVAQLARASVTQMRQAWDQGEQTAKAALQTGGVQFMPADHEAFAAACAPFVSQVLENASLKSLYRQVRKSSVS